MNYYELRSLVSKLIPRQKILTSVKDKLKSEVKIKGRKTNYHEFNLIRQKWQNKEKIFNTERIKHFIEVSLRAAACPMPLNADCYDAKACPFRCQYCFADILKATLYTSFWDRTEEMGIRSCPPDYFRAELDRHFEVVAKGLPLNASDIQRAIKNRIPIRLGIRFEDFIYAERKNGIALAFLNHLKDRNYPIMINTKSDLPAEEPYLSALADNPSKAAVHVTLISADNRILKAIEPGAPSYKKRLEAMRILSSAGIRVVARIEPWMVFINDEKEFVEKYIEEVYAAGVRHITFDTYSYSANNPGIRNNFTNLGYDFNRMYLLTSDSQALGSLLLGKFMDLFREKGFRCSTFDLGNVAENGNEICCEVGDFFPDSKFNRGSSVSAIWYIKNQKGRAVTWDEYEKYVEENGGFLSENLKQEFFGLWNLSGNPSYSLDWGRGIVPVGNDSEGRIIWKYEKEDDFRIRILEDCL